MSKILIINDVSREGLRLFGNKYQLSGIGSDHKAIIVRSALVDTDQYPNLVAVARAGAGVNNITVDRATRRGICVFNTPGANANAVAELVFVMLGLYARRINKAFDFVAELATLDKSDEEIDKIVEKGKSEFAGFELAGKTLGVIGLGRIGVLVANGGIERQMKVFGYDTSPTLENMHRLDSRVEVAQSMEEVLCLADVVSVHVPLSDKTKNLIGERQIATMKPCCILMNYARDGICNTTAVLKALAENRLQVYIVDFPKRNTLALSGVICTPHLGASTVESEENCAVMAVRQLRSYLELGNVTNSVNFPVCEEAVLQGVITRLAIANEDVPGVISAITGILAGTGVNIRNMTNKGNGKIGYNIIDLGVEIGDELVAQICQVPNVLRVRALKFSK